MAETTPAGDPITITVDRAGAAIRLRIPYPAAMSDLALRPWQSARRSGFDAVLTGDISINGTDCGGPVFTLDGVFVGIAVASMRPYVNPTVRQDVDPSPILSARTMAGAYIVPAKSVVNALSRYNADQGRKLLKYAP